MDDTDNHLSTPSSQQGERQPPPSWRSTNSNNWRLKDDSPRVGPSPRSSRGGANTGRGGRDRENGSSHQDYNSPTSPGLDEGNSGATGSRLYVGNLLYTAQKSDIASLFSSAGFRDVTVSISTDPFTGRNPSYCFVDVESSDEARRAIDELNGAEVLGRRVRVSPGVARKSNAGQDGDGARESRVKTYDQRGSAREERVERNQDYKPSFDRWNRNDAQSHWTAPQTEGRRLYIGNLPRIEPQSALDSEIQTLFATYLPNENIVPQAVSKLLSPHPSKIVEPGNHYYTFVDLERAEDVDVVIAALDGKEGSWGPGGMRVNKARDRERRDTPTGDGGERRERKVVREQGLGREGQEKRGFGGGSWRRD